MEASVRKDVVIEDAAPVGSSDEAGGSAEVGVSENPGLSLVVVPVSPSVWPVTGDSLVDIDDTVTNTVHKAAKIRTSRAILDFPMAISSRV